MRRIDIINDGNVIPAVIFESTSDQIKGVYILIHGLTTNKLEYLNFYKTMGEKLANSGYNVITYDVRTHGESLAPSNSFNITMLVSDAITVIQWAKNEFQKEKVNIFGTSFGAISAIGSVFMLEESVSRLTCLAPVLDFEDLYFKPRLNHRAERYASLESETVNELNKFMINDSIAFTKEMVIDMKLINLKKLLLKLSVPTTLIHGTADSMVAYDISENLSAKSKKIDFVSIDNMDHGFMDIGDASGNGPKSIKNIELIFQQLTK